jgi:hypothetical protein
LEEEIVKAEEARPPATNPMILRIEGDRLRFDVSEALRRIRIAWDKHKEVSAECLALLPCVWARLLDGAVDEPKELTPSWTIVLTPSWTIVCSLP